ncbi:MAG: hypothetical protein H7A50_02040 [Akkermansiaceae bacterium]|nr:hypothetical protein [Akkermansiaceae bacterium]
MVPIAIAVEFNSPDTLQASKLGMLAISITVAFSTTVCALALVLVTRLYRFIASLCTNTQSGLRPCSSVRQIGRLLNLTAIISLTIFAIYTLTAFARPNDSRAAAIGIACFAVPAGLLLLFLFIFTQVKIHFYLAQKIEDRIFLIEKEIESASLSATRDKPPFTANFDHGEFLHSELARIRDLPVWPSSWRGIATAVVYWLSTTLGIVTAVIQIIKMNQ